MLDVGHDRMLSYAGGDTDATFRLWRVLTSMLRRDRRQLNCYARIMMPAMRVFAGSLERHGMLIDQGHLQTFQDEVQAWVREEYRALIRMVPVAIRRRHVNAGKELSFTRPEFTKDVLFDPQGFGLIPRVFTKGTEKDPDPSKREPSTSAKDHLPWFVNEPGVKGEFVTRFIQYQKTVKLLGTYIEGFWKYITSTGRIHPSYYLHRTNTGRTASADPNGQNFPKRGRWAKSYLKVFQASPGYLLVNCDLSQIELRLAAWMAREPTMLRIYREGGDIHTATAQAVSGIGGNEWEMLDRATRKELRTKAKAVNFGFLYGMGPNKFREFAKTQYEVEYTEEEAKQTRERFFRQYRALPSWHDRMREYADEYGLVRALHGAARHLPSIYSTDEITRGGAQRQAINAPIQRFGSDLGLIAMSRFSAQANPDHMRIIGFVHDALVMEAKVEHAWDAISALVWCMQTPPLEEWFGITPPLPVLADADIGINGGDMIELAEVPAAEKRPAWFNALDWEVSTSGAVLIPAERPAWWSDRVEREEEARAQIHLAA
jgi:DNA polymerase I-like protein with 3'-5' exonuclease and polymerase domains